MKYKGWIVSWLLILISLSPAGEKPVQPSVHQASREAKALLQFFYDISGKYTVTGQHNYPNTRLRNSEFYSRYLGHSPVIYSTDWGFAEDGDTDSYLARPDIVQEAIRQHKAGALVTICWHAVPPTADEPVTFRPGPGSTPSGNLNTVQGQLTDEQFRDLLTPGTALYNHWCKQVDDIAVFLKKLDNAHVPILWRPYHEMNGNWFWWGGRTGEYSTRALYKQLFDRLARHHRIKNLVWIWSVDRPNRAEMQFRNFYPGDAYVDMMALDVYGRDFNQAYYDSLNVLSGGKPMVLGEVGNPPSPEILDTQPRWSYWVIWAGMVRSTPRKEHLSLLNDPRVLVLDRQTFWDAAAQYHKACGLTVSPELWIKPREYKHADFSGTWILDEDKSEFTNFGAGFAPWKMSVVQNEAGLAIEKTRIVEYADDQIAKEMIKLDGTESISNPEFMNSPRVCTANWSAWGDTLKIQYTQSFGSGENARIMKSSESWSTRNGGKELSIIQVSDSPRGRRETAILYVRE